MQVSSLRLATVYSPPTGTPAGNAPVAAPTGGTPDPVDRVEISAAALRSADTAQVQVTTVTETETTTTLEECPECAAGICSTCGDKSTKAKNELSEEEQAQVKELKERDAEVKAHEAAHAATGGSFAGSPSFEYQVGPDGKRYAIGGEVKIDTAPIEGDPQATIQKLQQVQAAALAPAEPSDQDRKVAQAAAAALREAQTELAAQSQAERLGEGAGTEPVEGTEAVPGAPVSGPPEAEGAEPSSEDGAQASTGEARADRDDVNVGSGRADVPHDSDVRGERAREEARQFDVILQQQVQTAAAAYQKIAGLV